MTRGWFAPYAASDTWKDVGSHYVGLYRDTAEAVARELSVPGRTITARFNLVHTCIELVDKNRIIATINMYGRGGSVFETVIRLHTTDDKTIRELLTTAFPAVRFADGLAS